MPVRGGGAAMLRELRDEERPALEKQIDDKREVLPEAEEVSPNAELAKDAPGKSETDKQTKKSYDNMTNNLTDKQSEQKSDNKADTQTRKQTVKPTRQSAIKLESQPDSQSASQSVADMIRRRAAQREEQEVLKTVTLKLSPSLDEKVEQYCFDHKMKKQEFWAEAAALYFEMIAEGEGS